MTRNSIERYSDPRRKIEFDFLQAVKQGDIDTVSGILQSYPDTINCKDGHEDSALLKAMQLDKAEVFGFLLSQPNLDLGESLLHAIMLGQVNFVRSILEKMRKEAVQMGKDVTEYMFKTYPNSTDFPDYVTPLMVAAEYGHEEIINLLLSEGHEEIELPHKLNCMCAEQCAKEKIQSDLLKNTLKSLRIYKALVNPIYICRVSEDPIYYAFRIVQQLKSDAAESRVFLLEFTEMIEQTQRFAADLIAECRSTAEVKEVLSQTEGMTDRRQFLFPRLQLAVDWKQYYFVAERNVQVVLEDAWVGDWYSWYAYSDLRRGLHFFGRILALPFVVYVCIFLPKSSYRRFYAIPLNRMITSVASYMFFLVLLFLQSYRDKKNQTRYQIRSEIWLQIPISVYLISQFLNSIKMLVTLGVKRFFRFKWNLFDIGTQLIFLMTMMFWLIAHLTMYSLPDLERKYWHFLDPQLVAEGLFTIGTVMAYLRLLLLLQVDDALGPLQVSLGKMTNDVARFGIILGVVIGSFTVGMCKLDEYYDGMTQKDPETGEERSQMSSFVGIYDTIYILFWAMFHMSSLEVGTVVIENVPARESDGLETINTHDFTQAVGHILFGVYTILIVKVLLSMLIAAMANTFQRVTDNVDVFWIFGRTDVYLFYMAHSEIPLPCNLCPLTWFRELPFSWIPKNLPDELHYDPLALNKEEAKEKTIPYQDLVKTLIMRYKMKISETVRNDSD